jgi:hypothetical protein
MDKAIIGIASYDNRIESLQATVLSLINQCDEMHIYLNDYSHVPFYLNNPKIIVYQSEKERGNLGDVGKFYGLTKINKPCYYLTCDDDLTYANNYVSKIITKIDYYKKEQVITMHGRNFNSFPVKSYYHGKARSYACLQRNSIDMPVQVGGTGAMGFWSDLIKINIDFFQYINMSDIYLAKYCNSEKILITCIAHNQGIIIHNKIDMNDTIYAKYGSNDEIQTKLINSIKFQTMTNSNKVFYKLPNGSTGQASAYRFNALKRIIWAVEITEDEYNRINGILSKPTPKVEPAKIIAPKVIVINKEPIFQTEPQPTKNKEDIKIVAKKSGKK